MTGDSNDASDDNTFLSGVKVILHPNISSTVDVLKEIGIKVDDKAEIKKNKWETYYPQKLTEGHCFLLPCPALLSLFFCALFHNYRLRLTIREISDHELVACQADNIAHR
jgi:hypothetical protein